ncbi:hypothetical protein D3C73_1481860 [compost metagenome]
MLLHVGLFYAVQISDFDGVGALAGCFIPGDRRIIVQAWLGDHRGKIADRVIDAGIGIDAGHRGRADQLVGLVFQRHRYQDKRRANV